MVFDQLVSAAVITNFAIYSYNFMQTENNKKKKKLDDDALHIDVARIMRSTLICSEKLSMASGYDPKFKSAIKGKGLKKIFCLQIKMYIYIFLSEDK